MFSSIYSYFTELFASMGISTTLTTLFINLIYLALIIFCAYITKIIGLKIFYTIIKRIAKRAKSEWDNIFFHRKLFRKIVRLLPAIVVYVLFPHFFADYPFWVNLVKTFASIYMVVVVVISINALLNAVNDIYQKFDISKDKPIKGYIQVFQILVYLFAIILIISFLINKNPLFLLGGLGAFMAILILVFKNPIEGFVSSLQLSGNNMVRIGDWITMEKYGADGDVLEITLASVKVRNFDNTIVNIPTYAMINNSFQNWRGMQESRGRRIKRSVYIDMNSVIFTDENLLNKLRKFRLIKEYINKKQEAIDKYNSEISIDDDYPTQYYGRRQTNLGIFRAYLEEYLKNHPNVNNKMLLMVRQLEPSGKGIPLEIYAFAKTTDWVKYESIQSDIFDHLISIVPEFKLRIFQEPTGNDLRLALKK